MKVHENEMEEIKNIIIISIDDLRFDCISCEEDKRLLGRYNVDSLVNTPTLDKIANGGVRFSQCISTSSYTPAPHASILTGLYPRHHGIKTFFDQLSSEISTLPEILKMKGWKTHAWCEHLTLGVQDITRGIDDITEPFITESNLFKFINGIPSDDKNFVFIHLFDVHKPYFYTTGGTERMSYNKGYLDEMKRVFERLNVDVSSLLHDSQSEARRVVKNYDKLASSLREYATYRSLDYLLREELRKKEQLFEELVPLYIRGVNKFDKGRFKTLLKELRDNSLLENSILIIISDHGETRCKWGEREDFMNSFNVSEGAIRVPFIIWGDHIPEGLEIHKQVSIIDIVPTILDFLQIKTNFDHDGVSLRPIIVKKGNTDIQERTLFSETWAYKGGSTFFGRVEGINKKDFIAEVCSRREEFKYIWRNKKIGECGYYNHKEDPFEENELPIDTRGNRLRKDLNNYILDYRLDKIAKSIRFTKVIG